MKSKSRSAMAMACGVLALASLASPLVAQSPSAQNAWVPGITEPIDDVTLSAPLAGIVGKRAFEEGQSVKKGEIIVELDKKLETLELDRRRLVMGLAESELKSLQSLYEKNSISVKKEELDQKTAEFNVANVEHQLAHEQMRRREISAPFDGTIVEIFLKVGEACQAQQPVARLVNTTRCYFIANVEARIGYALEVGQPVKLQVQAGSGYADIDGEVSFVSPIVDPASGLMRVKVVFDNPDGRIKPGVSGRAILTHKS